MAAQILDGKSLAASIRAALKQRVDALVQRGVKPGLAVVLAGDDPASRVYVRNKRLAATETGVHSELIELPGTIGQRELRERIEGLNANRAVHGILVQLPLPKPIDAAAVLEAIAPAKDVDGFHEINLGALLAGRPRSCLAHPPASCASWSTRAFRSPAPRRRHRALEHRRQARGAAALAKDATVTICHSKSSDLSELTRRADILIAAVGRPKLVRGDMVKPGACVIDVGVNRLEDGETGRRRRFRAVKEVAGWITPVPGGVGLTIAMLLENCIRAASRELIPLLDFSGLPRFADIKPEHVTPAMELLLSDGRSTVNAVVKCAPNLGRFRRAARRRERAHRPRLGPGRAPARGDGQPGAARGLQRQSAEGHKYWTELGQNQSFSKIQGAARRAEFAALSAARKRIVERDPRLPPGGAELAPEKKKRYAEIQEELARLSAKFSENLLDATNAFSIYIAKEKPPAFPTTSSGRARSGEEGENKASSSRCTCRLPAGTPTIARCARRCTTRAARAPNSASRSGTTRRSSRASCRCAARWRSSRLREFRRALARAQDGRFAEPGARLSRRPRAPRSGLCRKDVGELRDFAKAELGIAELQAWDVAYASEAAAQALLVLRSG